ncbi:DUF2076 domain-containing protein [Cupriavidus plantarum]|uniref:DUF2076 domain-containing protein n=1 Tax=Cupriavidus plantarum TaxID=942865 RepID=UPI0015C8C085|nr:DUF2076 family protein [Cupriavidus plantarum]NYH97807.1 hypothetical protein [Cupriavidus plantarum]
MTPQETQALERFLTQLTQARAVAKDPQAEAMIADAVARQPDAAYLLVQRALLLDNALASAREQNAALQAQVSQLQAAQGGGNRAFLDDNTWGNSVGGGAYGAGRAAQAGASSMAAPQPAAVQAPAPGPGQSPVAYSPAAAQPPARSGWLGGGLGGTLGSIATTAAGVAGGAFLFQGLENMFHRNSASNVLGNPDMAVLEQPNETVVNNYYGSNDGGSIDTASTSSGNSFLDDDSDNGSFLDDDSSWT